MNCENTQFFLNTLYQNELVSFKSFKSEYLAKIGEHPQGIVPPEKLDHFIQLGLHLLSFYSDLEIGRVQYQIEFI